MEVKGTAVISIRDYVKNKYPSDYVKWLDSLSTDAKAIYSSSIDSTKWYTVGNGVKEPTEKIGKLFFNGDLKRGALESGRYSAEKALTGIYKIFVMAANPGFIIKRASRVFATYYRPCVMEVVEQSEKRVVARISQITAASTIINRIIGWCETGLQISGCQNVMVSATHKLDANNEKIVELDMKWD